MNVFPAISATTETRLKELPLLLVLIGHCSGCLIVMLEFVFLVIPDATIIAMLELLFPVLPLCSVLRTRRPGADTCNFGVTNAHKNIVHATFRRWISIKLAVVWSSESNWSNIRRWTVPRKRGFAQRDHVWQVSLRPVVRRVVLSLRRWGADQRARWRSRGGAHLQRHLSWRDTQVWRHASLLHCICICICI